MVIFHTLESNYFGRNDKHLVIQSVWRQHSTAFKQLYLASFCLVKLIECCFSQITASSGCSVYIFVYVCRILSRTKNNGYNSIIHTRLDHIKNFFEKMSLSLIAPFVTQSSFFLVGNWLPPPTVSFTGHPSVHPFKLINVKHRLIYKVSEVLIKFMFLSKIIFVPCR